MNREGRAVHGLASSSFLGAARHGDARRWLSTSPVAQHVAGGGSGPKARCCGRDPELLIAK